MYQSAYKHHTRIWRIVSLFPPGLGRMEGGEEGGRKERELGGRQWAMMDDTRPLPTPEEGYMGEEGEYVWTIG